MVSNRMKMPTKEQRLNLLGILASASLTGVGFALGGGMGAEIMKGIGINLTTNIVHGGAVKIKEHWLSSNVGMLNHDIQQALTSATIKALENLEKRYLALPGDSISEDDKKYIKNLFRNLNQEAKNAFPASLKKAITEPEVEDYLYGEPEIAASKIWGRISHTILLEDAQQKWVREYFIKYFFSEMQYWFGEELKTDNKAWRAFQRLLLDGIQADVRALQVSHDLILEDLKKLDEIKALLKQPDDPRLPNEPFENGLNAAIEKISVVLVGIDKTTCRTEIKVDAIKEIVVETNKMVSRIEKRSDVSLYKERQEILEAIVKNYISQIPYYEPKVKEFILENRVDELTWDMTYLQDHRILLISGIGGVGKTTLAHALIEARPPTVSLPFWFDFNINMNATLGDVLEKLAGYMKEPELAGFRAEKRDAGQNDINRLISELQMREQFWLVFDNLETILNVDMKFSEGMDLLFTSLRGSTHNAKIIVTSRFLPLLNNGESLIDVMYENQELKGLKQDFAVDFLVKNGLLAVEPEKLEGLANGVDGHPLALKILIGLVKRYGDSDMLNYLDKLKKDKWGTIMIARKLFDKLATDEKELLESISVFRIPESMGAIKAIFRKSTFEDAVDKLIDKSLLETDHKGKYWLHPLVREFAYNDLEDKKESHKLACDYYLSLQLPEKTSGIEDVRHLIEAHHHACEAKEYDRAADIIFKNRMHEDLNRWGNSRTLIELYSPLLPEDLINGKPLLKNKKIHGVVLGNLGIEYYYVGKYQEAIKYYEQALYIAKENSNKDYEGTILRNLGKAYHYLGNTRKAIEYNEKAMVIANEIGDRNNEGVLIGDIGDEYRIQGYLDKSIECYERALAIAQDIGDRVSEGVHLGNLGIDYRIQRDNEKAKKFLEKALTIAQEDIIDKRNESRWLTNLGMVHRDLGDLTKAMEYYQNALKIAQEIGDKRNEGFICGELGTVYRCQGESHKAIEHYENALKIAQDIGDRSNENKWFGNLGTAYKTEKKFLKAIEYYKNAIEIAHEIKNKRFEDRWLGNMGNAYSDLGQMEKAIEYYEKALSISKDIRDRGGEGTHLNNLGLAFQTNQMYTEALACYLLAKEIRIQIKDPELKQTESNLSVLKEAVGENEFEKLVKEVEPAAEDIVMKMLE